MNAASRVFAAGRRGDVKFAPQERVTVDELGVDVAARRMAENTLRSLDLERFFAPTSVALIGASETEGSPAAGMTRFMLKWASQAANSAIYLVNPNRETIAGLPCYKTMDDVPVAVDLCAILVKDVRPAVEAAIRCRARYAIVFGNGFAESGEQGRQSQAALEQLVRANETRLFGPNTVLNAFDVKDTGLLADQKGIGLVTQSGHQGRPVFQAQENGTAVAFWATTGNEADVEFADLARFYADRPEVGVITAYIEGFRDGRTMLQAADHALGTRTPIVLIKVGRTSAGSAMALSHTGKLTGADGVAQGALRQTGVIRVDDIDELIEVSQMLVRAKPPQGDGVCLYSISGGTGAHLADVCASAGLRLPRLSDETQRQLHEWIPETLDVANPVDSGGHPTGDARGIKILETLVQDPDVAVLICAITGATPPMSDRFAEDLTRVAETTDKPVCVIWSSPSGTESAYRDVLLGSHRLITFRNFRNCARAVAEYLDYYQFASQYESPYGMEIDDRHGGSHRSEATEMLRDKSSLTEHQAKGLLSSYGVPVTREFVATSADEALHAAEMLGFPLVMKGARSDILHKSELGLVRTNIQDLEAVRRTFDDLASILASIPGDDSTAGVLLSEQVRGGVEMIVGVVSDPVFGPAVMVGLGGVTAELFKDVQFRVPPFTRHEARRMVMDLRSSPLLLGYRGTPPADLDALLDVIMGFQDMAVDLEGVVAEVEANPVFVTEHSALAADAVVVRAVGSTAATGAA
jgi:acyl-CoA synthetase (NDP forming)